MKTLYISISDKVARYRQRDGAIICGNSDYQIHFTFDSEWDAYSKKTARFIWNGKYVDVDFTNDICPVPIIHNAEKVQVGVYAGNLSTTTPAVIECKKSILCEDAEVSAEARKEYADEAKLAADRAEEAADRAEEAAERAEAGGGGGGGGGGTPGKDGISPTIEVSELKETIPYTQVDGLVAIPEGAKKVVAIGTCSGYMSGGRVYFVLADDNRNIISNAHIGSGDDTNVLDAFASLDIPDNATYIGTYPFIDETFNDSRNNGYSCDLSVKFSDFEQGGATISITDVNGTKSVNLYDGKNGLTPHIGANGNWWIGETDTGVKAEGKDGKGIKSIARTSGTGAPGTTDTYTITYTDNTTSTYTVYNGKDGADGKSIDYISYMANDTDSEGRVRHHYDVFDTDEGIVGSFTITDGKDGTSVTVTKVTESTADGGSNVVAFSDGKTLTVKNGKNGKDYVLTDADKDEIADRVSGDNLPDYWESYLPSKIAAIKALQGEGGKDCFSFVVMADMHYPSNLGKRSPAIAKRILDKCDIRYALCLGDVQTRGCHDTKELLLAENEQIEEMLSPIRDRLLQTEGNHDGSYGWLDRDGNGEYENTDANGNYKEPAARESYVSNLTPAELHSAIYRKVGLVGDVHFDESGSGYYIDDTANKVRYIVLNTHCNDYELQDDGTSKYPKMWIFRFTQPQFDLVIDALNNIPSASWGVVVAGHCPLWQEIGDADVMIGVLNAYKNKTTYVGKYEGTAIGAGGNDPNKNYADPLPNNTTDSTKWINDYRITSGGVNKDSSSTGITVTNEIPISFGAVVEVSGVDFGQSTRYAVYVQSAENGSTIPMYQYYSAGAVVGIHTYVTVSNLTSNSATFTVMDEKADAHTPLSIRFAIKTPANPDDVVIKVKSAKSGGGGGYDAVSVDCDFTNAKGSLVGYFAGHVHNDLCTTNKGFNIITTRCDAHEEHDKFLSDNVTINKDGLWYERFEKEGTIMEQSFDVFTVNKATRTIHATKIGAGTDREIGY